MYGGFQGGPQLGLPDAERRQSLGQLISLSVAVFQGAVKENSPSGVCKIRYNGIAVFPMVLLQKEVD